MDTNHFEIENFVSARFTTRTKCSFQNKFKWIWNGCDNYNSELEIEITGKTFILLQVKSRTIFKELIWEVKPIEKFAVCMGIHSSLRPPESRTVN